MKQSKWAASSSPGFFDRRSFPPGERGRRSAQRLRSSRSINQSHRRLQVSHEMSLLRSRTHSHGSHVARAATTCTRARYHGVPSLSSHFPGDDTLFRLNSKSRFFTPVMSRYGADNVKQPALSFEQVYVFQSPISRDRHSRESTTTVAMVWQQASFFLSFSRVERRQLDSALVHLLVFFLTHFLVSYLAAVPITEDTCRPIFFWMVTRSE